MRGPLLIPDASSLADLATYIARARRVDPDGGARVVASGDVLAVYVSPLHGGGGPTVLGLRVLRLADRADVDTTVALGALTDRLARLDGAAGTIEVPLPPMAATSVSWAGVSPPRSGWAVVGTVDERVVAAAARTGIDEVAAGAGSGAQAVTRLRALVWGRDLPDVPGVPSGAAFAADALGFVVPQEPVVLYAAGPWRRLTSARGHVLTRRSLL